MGEFSIGQSPTRLEDQRLLTGQGRFLDDINYDRQLRAVILRSPHAHAKILSIDTTAAKAAPGVHGVFTGEDYRADGMGVVPCMGDYNHRNGGLMYIPDRPALAVGKVMHIGYPVVLVVAETENQARDACELIDVDYEVLPAVTSCRDAFEDGAPQLYEDCPNNESYLYSAGDKAGTDKAFEEADHVVSHHLVINRVTANAMENRGVIGEYSPNDGRYTLRCGFQRPWLFRKSLADQSFKVPESKIRLVTDDIGGSYGLRGSIYPEMVLMPWVSKLKVRSWGNLGAFPSYRGASPPVVHIGTAIGVYTTPIAYVEVSGMLTNTHCTSPYRGAGRPEASFMIERMVEMAADKLGIDPAELRRKNTIPPEAMPYKTPLTYTYDCGEFEENMDMAMEAADWAGFPARRAESESRGKLRGIGMSNTLEWAADNTTETAEFRFDPTGDLTFVASTISHGQGHATIQRQIINDLLGIAPERVSILQGDTDVSAFGMGTGGSRSTIMTGSAMVLAANKIIAKGKKLSAYLMEASEADIEFADGKFSVTGTDKEISIHEVAVAAFKSNDLPEDMEPGLYETGTYNSKTGNFPNGCHICEVEIDPDTGVTEMVNYTVAWVRF